MITTTGIAFSLSAIGLTFCGLRFFEAFQKIGGLRSGSRVGMLISALFFTEAAQHGVLAIGGLFFAKIPEALYATLVIDHLILTAVVAIGVYLILYIFFPNFPTWLGTIAGISLGLFVTGSIIFAHSLPYITTTNSIDWNIPHWLAIPWYFLLLINIGSFFIIFTRNFFHTHERTVKTVSLIIALLSFGGLINVSLLFIDFWNEANVFRVPIFEILLVIMGLVFIIAFLFTPVIKWLSRSSRKVDHQ